MYKNVFGRNGINGLGAPTYARVHYDSAYDNAFYSDQCMCITYGDGTKLQTLTSLDVAAHEFSHGVCMTSAGLIYNKESGGLNEANSDIMGAMAEFYMRGANGKGSVIPDTAEPGRKANRSPPQLIHSKCVSCTSPARTVKVPTRGVPHCKT